MIVMKFGGSSVQNREMIDQALTIAEKQLNRSPVLVASAMGKTTDKLVRIADTAKDGDWDGALRLLNELKDFHDAAVQECTTSSNRLRVSARIDSLFTECTSLIKGLSLLRECTQRSRDAVLSFGELFSTAIIHGRALERGMDAELLDSRDFIRTDDEFTHANPLYEETSSLVQEFVKPSPGKLLITQGFIARTRNGVTTTLGRGGSDFTATIIGAALGASEVQIWTDVNGIMTTDPRIMSKAKTIESISYEEAAELAYFGAKVIHPSTIQPAVEKGIPVLVLNTKDPDGPKTVIEKASGTRGLRAIAGKKSIILIHVTSSHMLNAYGFLSRIFAIFERHKTPVDLIATSEVSVSMTIDNDESLDRIVTELGSIGMVEVERGKSIICLVGNDLWKDSPFIARVFQTLNSTPVRMVSLGSSDINLSLVVPEEYLETAISKLHLEFFGV
jgi:aspartate kinase